MLVSIFISIAVYFFISLFFSNFLPGSIGDFVWHDHSDTDEVFIVLDGEMVIEFEDGRVSLSTGEMFVVPKGVRHRPSAERECRLLLIEPRGVVNTGDSGGPLTAASDAWI